MNVLKTILQSKIFIGILIVITIIYTYYVVSNNYFKSHYKEGFIKVSGLIDKIKIDGNKVNITLKAKEKLIINYYVKSKEEQDVFKNYKLGDKLEVEGILNRPSDNSNFYLFNYRKYLLSNKIYYIMSADKVKLVRKNNSLFYKIKNYIYKRVEKLESKNYLLAFIIGDNNDIDEDIKNSYKDNGISHLFAISGLHITIFSSILFFILNKIIKHKEIVFLLISLFLIFYMFLTGLSPSIIRATIFFIILNINIFNLKTINLYLILLCIVLIINPYNIYNNGFLFSYIVSFYLILFNSIMIHNRNYFIKLLITSFISFIVGIPIMINSYSQINLLSIIFNLFYVPFITFIVFPLSLITIIIPIFDPILKICISILEESSLFLSKINIFTIILRHINILIFIFYYALISFILIMMKMKKYLYIGLLVILIFIHSIYSKYDTFITFLDVGQGDSIIVSIKNKNILIDTGGRVSFTKEEWMKRDYSISDNIIIPSLKAHGISKLNFLILTHGDFDHMGEAINLVNNFKVEKVVFNCGPYNDLENELIKVLDKKKIKYYSCIKELNIDKNKLYFLQTKEYDNENDNSNVIITELNGYRFMFMGDASSITEKEILNKYNLPDMDVLKVGHHGSKTSSSKEFIDEINPKYSIISVGKNNRYGHPNKEVLNNLKNTKIYRTDQDGSVILKIKNNKLKIETCLP